MALECEYYNIKCVILLDNLREYTLVPYTFVNIVCTSVRLFVCRCRLAYAMHDNQDDYIVVKDGRQSVY